MKRFLLVVRLVMLATMLVAAALFGYVRGYQARVENEREFPNLFSKAKEETTVRLSINQALTDFRMRTKGIATDEEWRLLERELAIIASTKDSEPRTDAAIAAAMDATVKALREGKDPRQVFERYIASVPIRYDIQKTLQWIQAYVYKLGYQHGKAGKPEEFVR